jgi:hypothetical protein
MKPVKSILAYCSCQEIKDSKGNEYHRIPEWHNCDYIRKRNKLIKQAEEYAEQVTKDESGNVDGYKFSYVFSSQMDKLAYETGLVR